jgi:hypothetical protein
LDVPLVHPGPGELLVRHDAAAILTSDFKVIRLDCIANCIAKRASNWGAKLV